MYLFHTDLLSHHQHVNLGPCCLFASRSHICVILCGYRGSLASSEQLPRCATQITMTTTTTTLITAALTHHHHHHNHHNHHHQQQHALFIYSQRNTFSHNVLLMYNSPFLHNLASHTYPPSSLYCPLLHRCNRFGRLGPRLSRQRPTGTGSSLPGPAPPLADLPPTRVHPGGAGPKGTSGSSSGGSYQLPAVFVIVFVWNYQRLRLRGGGRGE